MKFLNVFVYQQLNVILIEETDRLKTLRKENRAVYEEERQRLDDRIRAQRLRLFHFQEFCNSWVTLTVVLLLGTVIGTWWGVNLPDAALCKQENVMCNVLRRSPKVVQ